MDNFRDIIIRPIVSEKSMKEISDRKYTFKVLRFANKLQIKQSIKKLFNVDVESINIINVPSKTRKMGRFSGKTPQWKKAVVTLKEGQKIPELFEGM